MAVFVQKKWNLGPCVLSRATSVSFSVNNAYLYAWDEKGVLVARFLSASVSNYWIESTPVSSLAEAVGLPEQTDFYSI